MPHGRFPQHARRMAGIIEQRMEAANVISVCLVPRMVFLHGSSMDQEGRGMGYLVDSTAGRNPVTPDGAGHGSPPVAGLGPAGRSGRSRLSRAWRARRRRPDDEAAAYGRYAGSPSQADLERVFFLDDEDMDLVGQRRGEHMKIGFALQLVTARWLGTFLDDPLDVPGRCSSSWPGSWAWRTRGGE